MKKIISLLAAMAMLATMSITSFAATATMAIDNKTLDVADGTQEVVLNVSFELSEATSLYGVVLDFALPAGVTLTEVDTTNFDAICSDGTDFVKDYAQGKASMFEAMVEGTSAVDSLVIPCTFTVDTSSATVYTIEFEGETGISDIDSFENMNDSVPTATITVGAPAPSKTDVVIAAPAVEKSEEANGVYNAGFLADFTVDADANNAVKAVKFTVNNGSDNAETTVELGTTVEAGTVKVALNILNVTAGVELTTTVAPIAE